MENASKALIIAGAILLAIVIISLGLIVVNNTRETVDNANLNEQEIQAFNDKFINYEGTGKTAAQVKTLIQTITASNAASGRTVTPDQLLKDGRTTFSGSDIKTADKFDVSITEYKDGYVSKITIKCTNR